MKYVPNHSLTYLWKHNSGALPYKDAVWNQTNQEAAFISNRHVNWT